MLYQVFTRFVTLKWHVRKKKIMFHLHKKKKKLFDCRLYKFLSNGSCCSSTKAREPLCLSILQVEPANYKQLNSLDVQTNHN